jgi:hypothetical protein
LKSKTESAQILVLLRGHDVDARGHFAGPVDHTAERADDDVGHPMLVDWVE